MKSKFSYKSKRTIIIAAIITVLLAGTATGVYFFTKGNAQAQAAGDNNTTQEQYGEAPEENKNEQQNNTTENEQNKNEQGETTPNQQEEQETERQEQTTNNNQTTQNEQTTTTTTGEVPNQEYVTEREETVKNPWESLEVGWGPTQFASIASTANLTAKKSNLEIHKTVDKESVKIGDTLTYTISVKNNGDKVAKAIIYDNVPEGTVLLNKDNNEDENTKKLTWRVTVEPGETENVEFTVRVKAEKGTIKNSAIVNGKTTEETETGIINITGKKEVNTSEAKVGDTLTYTITLTNSGNADGTVTVTDEIPAGTTLVEKSITNNGVESNGTITWTDVEVKAGDTVEVSFKVTINNDTKTSVRNTAVIDDNKPTEEVETKVANITGAKSVDKSTAKVGDTLTYTITLTNNGNADGTMTVTDEIPTGTRIKDENTTGYNKETNTMTWSNVEVKANGETATLTLEVVVKDDTTDTVKNVAKIDNKEIPEKPETKVANITGAKSVDKPTAKVGDTLTYTIKLTNNGNGDGKVTVTDEIPTGTRIKDENTTGYNKETNTMTWSNVEVKAGKSAKLALEVVVEDNISIIKNIAYVDGNKIPEEPETTVKHHYTVEHYTENLDGTYSKVDKDTVVSEDVEIGTKVSYEVKKYEGFEYDESQTVNKDATVPDNNNLVVKLYYTRNSYKVTYEYEGTVPAGASNLPEEATYKYGANVTVAEEATAPGYTFSGWDKEDFTMPAEDVVIKGSFTANTDTQYKVEHYLQDLDGNSYTLKDTETLAGTTDTTATATPKQYPGFTYDSTVEGTKTEGVITGDGQLVLKLYYTRNSYKVTYEYEGTVPAGASNLPEEATYKYGANVTVAEEATAPGYTFSGWDKEDFTMPAEDVVIKGSFTANTDTQYKVEHYLQDLDGNSYTLKDTETLAGTTDTTATATPKQYPGFTYDSTVEGTKTEGVITGDGQLVLKLYYTRNNYKVTYEYEGTPPSGASALPTEETYKYGASVTVAEDATAPGYKFSGWDHEDFTMPAEDVVIKGSFEARNDTKYRVEHYLENLNDEGFTLEEGKDYAATTDTKVTAEPKEYPGFTFDSTVVGTKTEGIVTGDGQLVLKLYYTRNNYKVTYEYEGTPPSGASALPTEETYKYGASVTVAEDATAPGYKFSGWDHEDFTMPAEDVVIKGSFEARNDTKYRVEHYLENLNDEGFTLEEGKDYAATTDTKVTAEPKEYPGFTFDSTVVGTKTEGIVTGDGQLVLKLYYVRATYTYTIHYFYNGVEDEGKQEGPFQGKFGEKIDAYTEKNEEGKYTKYDVTSSNKTAEAILTIGTGVNFINVYYGTPQISINKAVSTSTANVGEGLHYTITVEETRGLVDATGVNVTDKIPEGLENITTNNGTINGENVEWNNLTIAKGSSVTLEFDATVKANMIGKTISNTATLGGSESGNSNTVITNVNEIQALTHELTPGQTGKDAANIVLVMDLSSSMNEVIKREFVECTHTRETMFGIEYCPEGCRQERNNNGQSVWGQWKNTTRLDAAKEAAQNFVNNVYAKTNASDPDSKATITVITFNQENYNRYDSKYVGTRVLTFGSNNKYTTATHSNYNELVTEIGNINIGTQTSGLGTHIRAALDKAYDTIYGTENEVGIATTYPNNSNYVIFLGDGDPTTSYNNNNKDSIDTSAQEIKDAGATIYSIGFGEDISDKNSTGYKILESISSEKKVYTANDSVTLTEIFKNLAGGMNDKTSATEDGKIIVTPERTLYFNTADGKKEYITVQYNGTTLMECKSQEELNTNEYLTYSEGKLSFDVNKWNSVESNTKIITGGENLVLKYYIERAN